MKKIVVWGLILVISVLFSPLYSLGERASDNEEELLKRGSAIEEEIDKLIQEIRKIPFLPPPEERKPPSVITKVISPAEITQTLIPSEKRDKKMNLNFDAAKLEDVLRIIGEAAGVNIVLDPALKGKKVDFHLKNIPIQEALSLIYNVYGLGSYRVGDSLYVSSKEKIKRETRITRIIKLENLRVDEAKDLIKDLVEVINTSKETNTLVVVGNPEDISKVVDILKKVDLPQPQVILEAKIIEIDRSALREVGIDWSDFVTLSYKESKRPATFSDPESPVGSPFRIYKLSRNALQFYTIIKMLEKEGRAKVLSNPRITTLNNKEAEIFVGKKVPYEVTLVSEAATTTEVRWVEPGIRLKITPSIIEKDYVVIEIKPEVSTIVEWRGPGDEYPVVKTREATAHVRVKNNQPFVLGGLLSKEDERAIAKVPLLGDLPLLGNLFKYERREIVDSELIISVAPTIVYSTQ